MHFFSTFLLKMSKITYCTYCRYAHKKYRKTRTTFIVLVIDLVGVFEHFLALFQHYRCGADQFCIFSYFAKKSSSKIGYGLKKQHFYATIFKNHAPQIHNITYSENCRDIHTVKNRPLGKNGPCFLKVFKYLETKRRASFWISINMVRVF